MSRLNFFRVFRSRNSELAAVAARDRASILLCALREFRKRTKADVVGGCFGQQLGCTGTIAVLKTALRLRYMSSLYLDPVGHDDSLVSMLDPVTPYSKAAGILAALERHGMPRGRILTPGRAGRLRRLGLKLEAVSVALAIRPWGRRLSHDDLLLVIACLFHARRLAGATSLTVHIGDRSPRRIALAAGAALAGRASLYWQNGYHDRVIPDLRYENAAVFNAAGAAAFVGRPTQVWEMDPPAQSVLRKPERIKHLGVATNAFAGPEIEAARDRVGIAFPDAEVALRLHPRIETFDAERVPGWDVRHRSQSLEDFARSCDVVICGNTAAQIEILMAGTPVIHIAGLDPYGFDLYGYVARGISFGGEILQDGAVVDAIRTFYGRPGWRERLQSEVAPLSSDSPHLRDFMQALQAAPVAARQDR